MSAYGITKNTRIRQPEETETNARPTSALSGTEDTPTAGSSVIQITPIAKIESDFGTKFGIPRQAGLVEELRARIVFEEEYRDPEALRGIEQYSRLWLIWQFSENADKKWSPTVRPPRLGGNVRMGVFATRSTFRPNSLGLSCVRLIGTEKIPDKGTTLLVAGADLMDGTPIFDIKPYIPYSDCFPEASEGFASRPAVGLTVAWTSGASERAKSLFPPEKLTALEKVLQCDPRPHYHSDPERVYGMLFAGHDVRFRVSGNELTVTEID